MFPEMGMNLCMRSFSLNPLAYGKDILESLVRGPKTSHSCDLQPIGI